eukprot:TRINITY_DN717_c0_g1_i2.p1 TRINITY_DN717_c0_g1~~TRINITY_DN717_c0_g1_i2.p1  ORF type:complete len:435 (+),score=120.93 TRINITY_DN717_c0_g1_i2:5-1309(+)
MAEFISMDSFYRDSNEIINGLYLGSESAAIDRKSLTELNITHIVCAGKTLVPKFPFDYKYFYIPIYDYEGEDIISYFWPVYYFIENAIRQDGSVLVHCRAGVSRSSTLCIAYLMIKYGITSEIALNMVKNKRSVINPNIFFIYQLGLFENCEELHFDPFHPHLISYSLTILNNQRIDNSKFTLPYIGIDPYSSKELQNYIIYRNNIIFGEKDFTNNYYDSSDIYKCSDCGRYLFYEKDIIKWSLFEDIKKENNDNHEDNEHRQDKHRIRPLYWMLNDEQKHSIFNIPKHIKLLPLDNNNANDNNNGNNNGNNNDTNNNNNNDDDDDDDDDEVVILNLCFQQPEVSLLKDSDYLEDESSDFSSESESDFGSQIFIQETFTFFINNDISKIRGELYCPKCLNEIGIFDWVAGKYQTNHSPVFAIYKDKVCFEIVTN